MIAIDKRKVREKGDVNKRGEAIRRRQKLLSAYLSAVTHCCKGACPLLHWQGALTGQSGRPLIGLPVRRLRKTGRRIHATGKARSKAGDVDLLSAVLLLKMHLARKAPS